LAAYAFLPWLVDWVDKPIYSGQEGLFAVGLLAMILYSVGLVPHYALFAMGKDKSILTGNVLAFLLLFPSILLLQQIIVSMIVVPLALCVSFASLLAWKSGALFCADRALAKRSTMTGGCHV
jgi:hypothetical protein